MSGSQLSLKRRQALPTAFCQEAFSWFNFIAASWSLPAFLSACRRKTKSSNAKPATNVAMMAIKDFLGFDFLSGGWAASSI
jgi:hypothetical protein